MGQNLGEALAAFSLVVMAQVDNLNAVETKFQFLGELLDALVITQKYWLAYTLSLCLHCSL